jgi:hypothetical protein
MPDDEPEIAEDMKRAMEMVGDRQKFFRMLDALTAATDFLSGHGWARFGVVMRKGPHEVVLTLDGAIQASAACADADLPQEIHQLAATGRRHDA